MPGMSTAHQQPQRDWITTAEAAALSGRSARTLRRWAQRDGWRSQLDMLTGGRAPVRFYRRADVLASVRATSGHVSSGAQVGAARDGAQGASLPALAQRLELTGATLERLASVLGEHRDALNRHSAALETQGQVQTRPWWDRAGDVGLIVVAALLGLLAGRLVLLSYVL